MNRNIYRALRLFAVGVVVTSLPERESPEPEFKLEAGDEEAPPPGVAVIDAALPPLKPLPAAETELAAAAAAATAAEDVQKSAGFGPRGGKIASGWK